MICYTTERGGFSSRNPPSEGAETVLYRNESYYFIANISRYNKAHTSSVFIILFIIFFFFFSWVGGEPAQEFISCSASHQ